MTNPVNAKDYQLLMKRLRLAREASGLTQREVAKKLRRPQSYVSKVERGERRIDPVELKQLAKIYRRPVIYFLS